MQLASISYVEKVGNANSEDMSVSNDDEDKFTERWSHTLSHIDVMIRSEVKSDSEDLVSGRATQCLSCIFLTMKDKIQVKNYGFKIEAVDKYHESLKVKKLCFSRKSFLIHF